jgi:hypothetical protein
MNRMRFLVVFTLALAGAVLHAQIPGYPNGCATCYVTGYMDIPTSTVVETVTPGSMFGATGWLEYHYDNSGADRIDVWWFDNAGHGHLIPSVFLHPVYFPRPDIGGTNNGWWIGVDYDGLPRGAHMLQINVWHGPYLWQPDGWFHPQTSLMRAVFVQ